MPKIGVIGSRGYNNYEEFKERIEYLTSNIQDRIIWVSGGCKSGGDALISRYCKESSSDLIEHLPDWDKYGKSAGFIRNKLIIDDVEYLIAFWNQKSKGTKNSLDLAEKKGIKIKIVKV